MRGRAQARVPMAGDGRQARARARGRARRARRRGRQARIVAGAGRRVREASVWAHHRARRAGRPRAARIGRVCRARCGGRLGRRAREARPHQGKEEAAPGGHAGRQTRGPRVACVRPRPQVPPLRPDGAAYRHGQVHHRVGLRARLLRAPASHPGSRRLLLRQAHRSRRSSATRVRPHAVRPWPHRVPHRQQVRRLDADAHGQADETSFRLQNRPDKRGFVWTYLADKLVAYVFSGDRSGLTPSRVLGGTTGSLVVDAYTGYNDVTDVRGRTRCGCFSHARRYLFRALEQAPEARDALDMILELFRVERDAMVRNVFGSAEHQRMRRDRSGPVLTEVETWIAEEGPMHLPEGPMGAALRYISNQWKPLTVFMGDPKIPIHNNASESALRIVALARKNSLFFGHEQAARNFSVLYSLVQTAERHGVNPLAYLEDVLMRVQTRPAARTDELLPDHWKPN